jgi:hypothetical protein
MAVTETEERERREAVENDGVAVIENEERELRGGAQGWWWSQLNVVLLMSQIRPQMERV